MSVAGILFLTASLLAVAAMVAVIPMMRRFEEEGRKIGFDFFSLRAGLWFFRPSSLPPEMEAIGRRMRIFAVLLLWPAFALLCVAWIIDR
jgi:hypothetical protein